MRQCHISIGFSCFPSDAVKVTRSCGPGYICCQSGGFIASGAVSPDKSPTVYLPTNLRPLPNEGFGEGMMVTFPQALVAVLMRCHCPVQTPLELTGGECTLRLGDCVFFRPAKAGEVRRLGLHVDHSPCIIWADCGAIQHLHAVPRLGTHQGSPHLPWVRQLLFLISSGDGSQTWLEHSSFVERFYYWFLFVRLCLLRYRTCPLHFN